MQKLIKTDFVFDALTLVVRELSSFYCRFNIAVEEPSEKRKFMKTCNDLRLLCDAFPITRRDVCNECYSISKSIDDMPNVARFLQHRLDRAVNEAMCDIDVFDYLFDEDYLGDVNRLLEKKLEEGYLSESEYHQVGDDFYRINFFLHEWLCKIDALIGRFSLKSESESESDQIADTTMDNHNQTLPHELETEEAKKWLNVAVKGGLLDADYQPTEKINTNALKALLAEILMVRIGLKNYVPFQLLWKVKDLAKQRYRSREEVGKVKGQEEIYKVFK